MNPPYDIFIPVAPKDFNKLPYVTQSILDNLNGYKNLIICSPVDPPIEILKRIPIMSYHYPDAVGLPGVDRNKWKFRPNWCFQQHLKLFQKLTGNWYVTLDCDTIINRTISFFENGKPICWKGRDQHYQPYFIFQKRMIDLPKISPNSFIADMNLFHRPVIEEMLCRHGYDRNNFILKSQHITNHNCHIGEPELYGSYCARYYPDMYVEKKLYQAPFKGREQKGVNDMVWSDEAIKARIEECKSMDIDTFSMHSWLDEGDQVILRKE